MNVVVNRVWDTVQGGFVRWTTAIQDPGGVLYPGPGVYGTNTSDYVTESVREGQGPAAAAALTTSYSPSGLYLFDGDILDSSGNGRDLSVNSGTARYTAGPVPGTRALLADGALRLSNADSAFQLTGDVTVQATILPAAAVTGFAAIAVVEGGAETEAANILYSLYLQGSPDTNFGWFHESGAGVDSNVTSDVGLPVGTWSHVASVRSGTTIWLFVNGAMVRRDTAQPAATGGTSSTLNVAANATAGSPFTGAISGLKIVPSAMTPEQILQEARFALPPNLRP